MYSPLVTNRNNSQCENGQIMASDPQGKSTPNTVKDIGGGCHLLMRQISAGPAVVSEFNPLTEKTTPAQEVEANPTTKLDANLLQ